jgi:hypothetical protein
VDPRLGRLVEQDQPRALRRGAQLDANRTARIPEAQHHLPARLHVELRPDDAAVVHELDGARAEDRRHRLRDGRAAQQQRAAEDQETRAQERRHDALDAHEITPQPERSP